MHFKVQRGNVSGGPTFDDLITILAKGNGQEAPEPVFFELEDIGKVPVHISKISGDVQHGLRVTFHGYLELGNGEAINCDGVYDPQAHSGTIEGNADNNFHTVVSRTFDFGNGDRTMELIHQGKAGDCILAAYLNTCSIEGDGKLPMSVQEARELAIDLRIQQTRMGQRGEVARDILSRDSALDYEDAVRLFRTIYGVPAEQDDILTVNGNLPDQQRVDQAETILKYLDSYSSGLCLAGLGYHARTIKKLPDGCYAIIDPMTPQGITRMSRRDLCAFIATRLSRRHSNDNFFFFIRK